MTIRVFARQEDGTEVDVTEGVQALYDHCVCSMDWGSGFLTIEDAEGIIRIAQTCGYEMPDAAAAAFEAYARRLGNSTGNNIVCATCGEGVRWVGPWGASSALKMASPGVPIWEREPVPANEQGWHHKDHSPGHPVLLWR